MATVQTIATTLTADSRPAVQSLRTFDAEVGKAFSRLDAMNKRAFSSDGGGPAGALNGMASASSNASRGVLELSRGIEDFSTQFGTQGLAGGIRAASNNLSQMAMVMGGPVAGAVAGFAAAGATLAMPYIEGFFNATEQAKRFSEQLDIAIKKSRDLFEERSKEMEGAVDFRAERRGLDESKDAESEIKKRQTEIEKLNERLKQLDEARQRIRFDRPEDGNFEARFGVENADAMREKAARADQEDFRLANERLELLRKERDLKIEIGQLGADKVKLLEKERDLQKQKDADEFAGLIRKFQEEDQRDEERRREREEDDARRKQERDANKLENILDSRLKGLGGKTDPLEGMEGIPDALKSQIRGLLGEIDDLKGSRSGSTAQSVTKDSQSLVRAQAMAKDAAERKRHEAKLIQRLEDLIREVRKIKPAPEVDDGEDVNLV